MPTLKQNTSYLWLSCSKIQNVDNCVHPFSESHRAVLCCPALFSISFIFPLFIIFPLQLSSARNTQLYLYPQETQGNSSTQSRYIEILPLIWTEYSPRDSITSVLSAKVRKLVMLLKSNNGGTCNLPRPPIFLLLLNKEMKISLQISCTNTFSHLLDEMELGTLSLTVLQLSD